MSNFVWQYYTFSFTCSLYFNDLDFISRSQLSNSCSWEFYVLIQLSWNFVGLLSTSISSWIYHYFWLSHIFMGDNWCVSWLDESYYVGSFMNTVQSRFFKLCIIITLLGVCQCIPDLMTLSMFQGHRCVRIINHKLCFRFLSTIVQTL